jgi:ribosomal protein S4
MRGQAQTVETKQKKNQKNKKQKNKKTPKTLIHVRKEGCQQHSDNTLSPSAVSLPRPAPSAPLICRKSGWGG